MQENKKVNFYSSNIFYSVKNIILKFRYEVDKKMILLTIDKHFWVLSEDKVLETIMLLISIHGITLLIV